MEYVREVFSLFSQNRVVESDDSFIPNCLKEWLVAIGTGKPMARAIKNPHIKNSFKRVLSFNVEIVWTRVRFPLAPEA